MSLYDLDHVLVFRVTAVLHLSVLRYALLIVPYFTLMVGSIIRKVVVTLGLVFTL